MFYIAFAVFVHHFVDIYYLSDDSKTKGTMLMKH